MRTSPNADPVYRAIFRFVVEPSELVLSHLGGKLERQIGTVQKTIRPATGRPQNLNPGFNLVSLIFIFRFVSAESANRSIHTLEKFVARRLDIFVGTALFNAHLALILSNTRKGRM
jgi:hypothetical protein